jgi:hypothetical protein
MGIKSLLTCSAGLLLSSCASADRTAANISERIADMPQWMGGLPPGVPPRRGTPETMLGRPNGRGKRRGLRTIRPNSNLNDLLI